MKGWIRAEYIFAVPAALIEIPRSALAAMAAQLCDWVETGEGEALRAVASTVLQIGEGGVYRDAIIIHIELPIDQDVFLISIMKPGLPCVQEGESYPVRRISLSPEELARIQALLTHDSRREDAGTPPSVPLAAGAGTAEPAAGAPDAGL